MLNSCSGINWGKLLPSPCHLPGVRKQEQVAESSSQGPCSPECPGSFSEPCGERSRSPPRWHMPGCAPSQGPAGHHRGPGRERCTRSAPATRGGRSQKPGAKGHLRWSPGNLSVPGPSPGKLGEYLGQNESLRKLCCGMIRVFIAAMEGRGCRPCVQIFAYVCVCELWCFILIKYQQ